MSGTADNGCIYPGDKGILLGHREIYGFQGSVHSGGYNPAVSGPDTLAPSASSRSIAIAARPGDHPATQRQLLWIVRLISGTAGLNLQVSFDGTNDWITIDTYTGTTDSVRVVGAESGAASLPNAQVTAKILSGARYVRVTDTGSGTTAKVDIVCQ